MSIHTERFKAVDFPQLREICVGLTETLTGREVPQPRKIEEIIRYQTTDMLDVVITTNPKKAMPAGALLRRLVEIGDFGSMHRPHYVNPANVGTVAGIEVQAIDGLQQIFYDQDPTDIQSKSIVTAFQVILSGKERALRDMLPHGGKRIKANHYVLLAEELLTRRPS